MNIFQKLKFFWALLISVSFIQFVPQGHVEAQPPCNMDFFQLFTGPCYGANNTFQASGEAQFSNPPAGGQLIIEANNGTSTYDTVINPPFVSPQTWSITNQIPANGGPVTYSVYFTADPGCTNGLVSNAPPDCGCAAQIGSFTSDLVGSGLTDFVLCFNDEFTLTSTGGYNAPEIANNPPGPPYNPGIGYLVYTCPPTIGLVPTALEDVSDDPCLLGVVGSGNTFSSLNDLGVPPYAGGVNNTLYYVPITLYDQVGLFYSYVNTNIPCYELGDTYAVQYLPEIVTNAVPDCMTNSVTVTINGGLPQINGSQFTASNLQPLTATFGNTTAVNGGTIVINDLQNGDMYSFDIIDDNGCPQTVTGGPFVGTPVANAGTTDTICALDYQLNATPSSGVGSWTGDPGVFFTPNVTDPNATVTANAPGTYNITWTENNNGCVDSDDIMITFSDMSIPNVITGISCPNLSDGQVTIAPQGGVMPYTYSWTSGGNMTIESNLGPGPVTVTVTDDANCSLDSTFNIIEPAPFTFTVAADSALCNQPSGWAAIVNLQGGVGGYTYDWGAGQTPNDTLFNLVPGDYVVVISDNNGAGQCDSTVTIPVGNTTIVVDAQLSSIDATCPGGCDGSIDVVANGNGPFNYAWVPGVAIGPQAIDLCANTYQVTVTDAGGCDITLNATISDPPDFQVTLSADTNQLCIGDSTWLHAEISGGTGPYDTYLWDSDPLDPTLDVAASDPLVFPTVNTTYTLVATDAAGCPTDPNNIVILVNPPLDLAVISPMIFPDTSICPYDYATLNVEAVGGNGNYTYYLMPDSVNPVQLPMVVQPPYDSTYTFYVLDGCTTPADTAESTVSIYPLPQIDFVGDSVGCQPYDMELFSTTNPGSASLVWDFGDPGSDSNTGYGTAVGHTYDNAGTYDITITATSLEGCVTDSVFSQHITVHPTPVATFNADPTLTTLLQARITFEDHSFQNIINWTWNFGDGSGSTIQHPSHVYSDTGVYLVQLLVENEFGCFDDASRLIEIDPDFTFYIPNAFSPNDDGINDFFQGYGEGFHRDSYIMRIFDRWGEEIYTTRNYDLPWNGIYQGRPVESSVYVYRIEVVDLNSFIHKYIGHVTLVR